MSDPESTAVNPATGELLEHLDQQPGEELCEVFAEIQRRQAEHDRWADAIAVELRRRLKMRQTKLAVFGDWEVEATTTRSSVWDWAELEGVLKQLVDDGALQAKDATGVLYRELTGHRNAAKRVASLLDGDARKAVEACMTWREKPGKLTVVRSVDLLAAAPPDTPPAPAGELPAPEPDLDPMELFA